MDNREQIRDFLVTRRAKLAPEQVGLPGGGRRRVPGLRREEVAVLAGVSPEWYTRLEKGHIAGVSEDVLNAVTRALQLSDVEREHLFNLARAAKPARTPRRPTAPKVPVSVQRVLDSMVSTAAFVRTGRLDIVAGNALGLALYSPVLDEPAHRATSRGSTSSIPGPGTTTPTRTPRCRSRSRCCAPRPVATRTTLASPS